MNTRNPFTITTDRFKGPLEMLLELIEARKMHISDVSLSQVAEKFLEYLDTMEEVPLADTANFVYIASVLILIKSKSLLPGLDLSPEETASMDDLEARLALLKLFRDQSSSIRQIYDLNNIYLREESTVSDIMFVPPENINLTILKDIAKQIIAGMPVVDKIEKKTIERVISLEEMIGDLSSRIQKTLRMSFKEFSGLQKKEKVNVIVSFLAMLELVKRGIVNVTQHADFSDIEIEALNVKTPTYT
ncbi:MAG TPA: segregation/condensation protein A [Candidatus Paceibacterota bacterium]